VQQAQQQQQQQGGAMINISGYIAFGTNGNVPLQGGLSWDQLAWCGCICNDISCRCTT
jgi:hypothetical protein